MYVGGDSGGKLRMLSQEVDDAAGGRLSSVVGGGCGSCHEYGVCGAML